MPFSGFPGIFRTHNKESFNELLIIFSYRLFTFISSIKVNSFSSLVSGGNFFKISIASSKVDNLNSNS